jgi:hypothetical protein
VFPPPLLRHATTIDWDEVLGHDGPLDSVPLRAAYTLPEAEWRDQSQEAKNLLNELDLREQMLAVAAVRKPEAQQHFDGGGGPRVAEELQAVDRCDLSGATGCFSQLLRCRIERLSCCQEKTLDKMQGLTECITRISCHRQCPCF